MKLSECLDIYGPMLWMHCYQTLLKHNENNERLLCVQHFVEQGTLQEFAQLLALLSSQLCKICKESRKEMKGIKKKGLWITESSRNHHRHLTYLERSWESHKLRATPHFTSFHIISHHFTPPLGLQDLQCWPGYEPASRPFRKHPWCLRGAWRPCKSYLQALQGLAGPCRALQGLAYLSYLSIFHDWPCFSSLHQWTRVDTGNIRQPFFQSCHFVPCRAFVPNRHSTDWGTLFSASEP